MPGALFLTNKEQKYIMYSNSLNCILQAARLFPIVPNHGIDSQGKCLCYKKDCLYPGKHPSLPNGFYGASQDEATLRKWHKLTNGNMNIGFRMGNGLCVFDIDPRNGGDETFSQLEAIHGSLPRTPKVRSGGGGRHFYFRCPKGLKKKGKGNWSFEGIDLIAEGSQVVAPPSLHFSGNRYQWELAPIGIEAGCEQVDFADLPEWILNEAEMNHFPDYKNLVPKPEGNGFKFFLPEAPIDFTTCSGVGQGERHERLLEYAGRHLARGENIGVVLQLALAWGAKCSPPFPEGEIVRQIEALGRKCQQQPFPLDESQSAVEGGRVEGGSLKTDDCARIPQFHLSPAIEAVIENSTIPPSTGGSEREGDGIENSTIPPSTDESEKESSSDDGQGKKGVVDSPSSRHCLKPEAFHGILGSAVKAIEQETEADASAILLALLTGFGNAIGNKPHFVHEKSRHPANLFCLLVGDTSSGKGQATDIALWLLKESEAEWHSRCLCNGLGSGDGLVERLSDATIEADENGNLVASSGATDKRLLVVESEFFSVLRQLKREGNTLSPMLRNAWDGKTLEVMNRKKNYLRASLHHVSIIGNITPDELAKGIGNTPEVVNGFANRFLFCKVKRSRLLPFGGNLSALDSFIEPLKEAIAKAKGIGLVRRTKEADELWKSVYSSLAEGRKGAFGKATERARPQVMRLALVYALADGSEVIDVCHLKAGLAVWDYCEASARDSFGEGEGEETTTLSSLPKKLIDAIRMKPGILRTELWDLCGHKMKAEELASALAHLESSDLAFTFTEGRGEKWYPSGFASPSDDPKEAGGRVEGGSSFSFILPSGEDSTGGMVEGGILEEAAPSTNGGGRVESVEGGILET